MNRKEWLKTLKEIKNYCKLIKCCGCMFFANGRCELYREPLEWNFDKNDSNNSCLEG